jgi:hypothetical protein
VTNLLADLRYAVRVLRKSPGFTAVAIVASAIGIGANVTIFSIANTFVLRQLPIADPSSAIRVYRDRDSNSSCLDYVDFRDRNRTSPISGCRWRWTRCCGRDAIACAIASAPWKTAFT